MQTCLNNSSELEMNRILFRQDEKLMTGGMTKQQMKVLLETREYVMIKGKKMR